MTTSDLAMRQILVHRFFLGSTDVVYLALRSVAPAGA